MDQPAKELWDQINRAIIKYRGVYAAWSKKHAISYNEMLVFYTIRDSGFCTQKQICDSYLLPRQTMNHVFAKLCADGIIEVSAVYSAGREKAFVLTERGQAKIIRKIADGGSCVIVGRAADYVLRDCEDVVRVFVHAPKKYRIKRVMEIYGDSLKEAKRNIRRSDKVRAVYYRHISSRRWADGRHYNISVDSSIGVRETADLILEYVSNN